MVRLVNAVQLVLKVIPAHAANVVQKANLVNAANKDVLAQLDRKGHQAKKAIQE